MINMMHARNEDYPIYTNPGILMRLDRHSKEAALGHYDGLIDSMDTDTVMEVITSCKADAHTVIRRATMKDDLTVVRSIYNHMMLVFG